MIMKMNGRWMRCGKEFCRVRRGACKRTYLTLSSIITYK
jgi:hypothetical protein